MSGLMRKALLFAVFLVGLAFPAPSFAAFTHYTTCTIQTGQVPSAYSKPINSCGLVGGTQFKTVGNGGFVTSSAGYDIRPYLTSCSGTALTFKLVFYSASGGTFAMYIAPSTSFSDGTIVFMCYGNSSLTTDGSSTSTWGSTYKGAWLLPNGTTLSINDSTSNARNCTSGGSPAATTSGISDGALQMTGSSDGIACGTGPVPTTGSYVGWFYPTWTQSDSALHYIGPAISQGGQLFRILHYSDNHLYFGWYNGADGNVNVSSYTLNQNAWNQLAMTWDSAAPATKAYLNGSVVGSTNTTNGTWDTSGVALLLFNDGGTATAGDRADEAMLLDTVLTANEITTQYNNLHAPSSFWTVGSDTAIIASSYHTCLLLGAGPCE